jgi:hypothetical protein
MNTKRVLVPNLVGNSEKIVVFAMSWVFKEKKKISAPPFKFTTSIETLTIISVSWDG